MLTRTEHSDAASLPRNIFNVSGTYRYLRIGGCGQTVPGFFGFELLEHSAAEVLSDG